jgi:hypothetical protein
VFISRLGWLIQVSDIKMVMMVVMVNICTYSSSVAEPNRRHYLFSTLFSMQIGTTFGCCPARVSVCILSLIPLSITRHADHFISMDIYLYTPRRCRSDESTPHRTASQGNDDDEVSEEREEKGWDGRVSKLAACREGRYLWAE